MNRKITIAVLVLSLVGLGACGSASSEHASGAAEVDLRGSDGLTTSAVIEDAMSHVGVNDPASVPSNQNRMHFEQPLRTN